MNTLDAAREALLDELSRQYAAGILSAEQFDARTDRAVAATSQQELASVRDGLPSSSADRASSRAPSPQAPSPQADYAVPSSATQSLTAILGERKMRGAWLRERHVQATVVLGSMEIDLRECTIADGTTIAVTVGLGELTIRVPHGVRVDNAISSVLAEVADKSTHRTRQHELDHMLDVPGTHHEARLRLTGSAVLAEVSIVSD